MGAEAALGLIYIDRVRRPSDLTRLGGTTHIECSAVCYLKDDPSTAEARVRSNRYA